MSRWLQVGLLGVVAYYLQEKFTLFINMGEDGVSRVNPEYELKLVQVIYRHGARTPLKPLPHKDQVEWSPAMLEVPKHTQFDYTGGTFPGQLTTVGMQQMFNLGLRLRKDYVEELNFLSPAFKPSEVFVRSTNFARNLESTRCLLAGLFHQQQEGPVTIVTAEAASEILYPNYYGCEQLKQLNSNKMSAASSQPGMMEDLKKIQQELNIDTTKEVDFFLLLDNLLAQEVHGFPSVVKDKTLLQRIEERTIDIISYITGPSSRKGLQLSIGPFLYTIQRNMLEGAETQNRKLYLYAAHDVTLIPLLMVFGIFDKKWPPYASDITVELYQHQLSKEWAARLRYNGEVKVVRGCHTGLCPLKDFLDSLSEFVLSPEDYRTLCSTTDQEKDK
ncbi:hypothetical protein GDO86_002667 [Hymenochirus boettgeri]|uniref:Acid phosphatase 6, lysophosphatidic n=1 Tax=Hymenochirus boettgeri TaxID=247094 RepID=A0A8T2JXZ8_9PIPI|nr:hypothetical protein GDO86_002667 [Hymenochirus boettgeri]